MKREIPMTIDRRTGIAQITFKHEKYSMCITGKMDFIKNHPDVLFSLSDGETTLGIIKGQITIKSDDNPISLIVDSDGENKPKITMTDLENASQTHIREMAKLRDQAIGKVIIFRQSHSGGRPRKPLYDDLWNELQSSSSSSEQRKTTLEKAKKSLLGNEDKNTGENYLGMRPYYAAMGRRNKKKNG
jgi:hypothetical protein